MGEAETTRRVRPSIAALLTFIGLGLGFYYAGRSRTAFWLTVFLVVAGPVVAISLWAAIEAGLLSRLPDDVDPRDLGGLINVAIALPFAIWAWLATLGRQAVPRASPRRLWGYAAIWLGPILIVGLAATIIRVGFVQPFRMPSGSMQPTIEAGDYFLVNKRAYGYSRMSSAPFVFGPPGRFMAHDPRRGDLVVFRPLGATKDYVKRLVGLPGDEIQIVDGVLIINGQAVQRTSLGKQTIRDGGRENAFDAWRETLPNGVSYTTLDRYDFQGDHTEQYRVPAGHYFMLGDDRDNSADSRMEMGGFGFVPFDNLVGRVDRIAHRRKR